MTQRTPYLRPDDAPKTSHSATWALVSGIASFVLFCAAPALALLAVTLGVIGLREVASTGGRMQGKGYAIAGIALGAFNVLAMIMLFVAFAVVGTRSSPTPAVTTTAPPWMTPAPPPTGSTKGSASDEGKATRSYEVREVKIGNVTLVDIPPTKRSLETELEEQRDKALKAKERLVLFTVGDAGSVEHPPCRPCTSVTAHLGDPKMQAAFGKVRLVRVDTYELRAEIEDLGAWTQWTPGLFPLGPDLAAQDGIDGGEWDDDTPDNMAPVIGAFLHGKLPFDKRKQGNKRVTPKKPTKGHAKPAPTML